MATDITQESTLSKPKTATHCVREPNGHHRLC